MRASRRPRANAATPSVDSGTGSVINNERESVATESQSGVANVPISSARVSMQRHLARPTLGAWKINQTVLLLVIGLAIVGISVIIGQRFGWPVAVMTWWPAAILIWALIWLIRALLRYSANGWLASCALLGLAFVTDDSLWYEFQQPLVRRRTDHVRRGNAAARVVMGCSVIMSSQFVTVNIKS